MTTRTLALAALLALSPAVLAGTPASGKKATPVPDTALGLSKTSVFDVPAPAAYVTEASPPGEKPPPARISTEIPPVVPHGIADFLPITAKENACTGCHELGGTKVKGEPTPIPASHAVDYRHDPARRQGEKLAGARWVCVSCHVPRTDARPLVGNGFRP